MAGIMALCQRESSFKPSPLCGMRVKEHPESKAEQDGAVFFRPCPSGYCPGKEYSLKPCKYRRNELPPMESIGQRKMGGMTMGSYSKYKINEPSQAGN